MQTIGAQQQDGLTALTANLTTRLPVQLDRRLRRCPGGFCACCPHNTNTKVTLGGQHVVTLSERNGKIPWGRWKDWPVERALLHEMVSSYLAPWIAKEVYVRVRTHPGVWGEDVFSTIPKLWLAELAGRGYQPECIRVPKGGLLVFDPNIVHRGAGKRIRAERAGTAPTNPAVALTECDDEL